MKSIGTFVAIQLLTMHCVMLSVTIGSDTTVNRFSTKQILNTGDRIAGFAGIEGGMGLFDSNVTATFDSSFPVSGPVTINGGILLLNEDLILRDNGLLANLGSIQAGGHRVELSVQTASIPSVAGSAHNCFIELVTTQTQLASVQACSWSYDNLYLAIGLAPSASTPEIRVYEFNGSTLTLKAAQETGNLGVFDIRWHPSLYLLAVGRATSAGDDFQIYSFNAMTGLTLTDSDEIGSNVHAVAWHPTGDYIAAGTPNDVQELLLWPVNSSGILNKPARITVDISPNRDVNSQALDWDVTGSYLAVGTGAGGAELLVYTFDTSPSLALTLNASVLVSGSVNTVGWNPTQTNILTAGLGSPTPRLRFYTHNPGAGTLTQILTESSNLGEQVRLIHWDPEGSCMVLCKDPGVGGELRTYLFDPTIPSLLLLSSFDFASAILSARWDPEGVFMAAGGATNNVQVYKERTVAPHWCWSNVRVVLNSDVTIKDSLIQFIGNSSFIGRGNSLTLDTTTTFLVTSNANLLFEDLRLQGDGVRFMQGADTTSTVTFHNVRMVLDNDYSFTSGRVDILRDLHLLGSGRTMAYRSTQSCTLNANSRLIIDHGVTFSYDPLNSSPNLLKLLDTARIVLRGGTLHATSTTLQLSKGTVDIERNSAASSGSSGTVKLGDGVSSSNNTALHVSPAAQLQITGNVLINDI